MTKENLFLLFFSTQAPFILYRLDQEGQPIEKTSYTQLSDITLPDTATLLVLLRGESLLATSVHLPGVSRSEWPNVIPYALENELIENIDDYLFAFGHPDASSHVPVLVIKKKYFEQVLEQLETANLSPTQITADFMALPYTEHDTATWTAHYLDHFVAVRINQTTGFTIEMNHLAEWLNLYADAPQKIQLMSDEEVPELSLSAPVETTPLHFNDQSFINLLQGKYRKKKRRLQVQPRWRLSFYASVTVIALFLLSYIGQYVYFRHYEKHLQQNVQQVYRQLFPGQTIPSSGLRTRVQNLLTYLVRVMGSNDFMRLLKLTGGTLKQYASIDLLTLQYKQPTLLLRIQAEKLATINHFILSLTQSGLQVQQTQKTTLKNKVIVNLQINGATT